MQVPLKTRITRRTRRRCQCWIWQGARSRKSAGEYGHIKVAGRVRYVHRVAFECFVGPIPKGLQVHHVCGNTLCVNPAHLQAVHSQTNNAWRVK